MTTEEPVKINLSSVLIAGNILYLNGDEKYPIQLPTGPYAPTEPERLVIEYCTTDYDEVNYVDEENVKQCVSEEVKRYLEGKPVAESNAGNNPEYRGSLEDFQKVNVFPS